MTEIEKMQRYIERTNLDDGGRYNMGMHEAFVLARQAHKLNDLPLEIISLAFNYGKAKGYRAAKKGVRA